MKIAILSDAHDQISNMKKAIEKIETLNIDVLLFCGDFCSPPVLRTLISAITLPIHVVFGNNDGDRFMMSKIAFPCAHVTLHGEHAALELEGKRIGMTHYPFYATAMVKSGDFDLVCFGHDHEARVEVHGSCLSVNPGSILGDKNSPSFAIYDTATHKAELISIE